jgi:predicted PurR-regulated permease PerM
VPFTQRVIVVLGLTLLAVLLAAIVVIAADVLLVFFGGVLLAVFLRGLVDLLSDHSRLSERASLVTVLGVLGILVFAGGWFITSEIAGQLSQLSTDLADSWQKLGDRLRRMPWVQELLSQYQGNQGAAAQGGATQRFTQIFTTTLGAVVNIAIIVVIGIYVAIKPEWYRQIIVRMVPPSGRPRTRELLNSIEHSLRWWLFGRAVGMTAVGIITTVGLWLLGVPLAPALGLIAALLDFVPNIGPLIAAAPAVLLALSQSPTLALYVVLLYLGVQLLEGYVMTPLIEQRSVQLPPAATIGAQVLFGVLVGALGVVFATPLTAVIALVVKNLYIEDTIENGQPPAQRSRR